MKVFGCEKYAGNDKKLIELSQVVFQADESQIRKIAGFLSDVAELMEKNGDDFGHEHFQDNLDDWNEELPDIIVARHQG